MDAALRYLWGAPTVAAPPPLRTHAQTLPLQDLTWQHFERLCLRLAESEAEVEQVGLYGLPGQAQGGIDIFARLPEGTYSVYQCRRVERFTAGDLTKVVDDLLSGEWAEQAARLVLCTSADLSDTNLALTVEEQNARLQTQGKTLVTLDREGLSRRLKGLPRLVLDFFDRAWLEEFCPDASEGLRRRLGAADAGALRLSLSQLYANLFSRQDAAVLLGLTTERDRPQVVQDVSERREFTFASGSTDERADNGEQRPRREGAERDIEQRIPLQAWLNGARAYVLSADAGSGKSSLLRQLAVDLLSDTPGLAGEIAAWRDHIPVWIPFGFWVRCIERNEACSLADAMHSWLSAFSEEKCWPLVECALEDERLLLFVDGLDEWVDADAAGTAFERLVVFVEQRQTPLLATTRPSALAELGPLPPTWHEASLAGLTLAQQRELLSPLGSGDTEPFLQAVARAPSLARIARTPLLLVLLFSLFRSRTELPQNRFKAYGESLAYLVKDHPRRRGSAAAKGPLDSTDTTNALAALAYTMQCDGTAIINAREASACISEYLSDGSLESGGASATRRLGRELVGDAQKRLGILVAAGTDGVMFLHRSFQEHLAAVYIASMPVPKQRELMAAHAPQSGWREVVLNVLSLTEGSEGDRLIDATRKRRSARQRAAMQPLLAEIVACGLGTAPTLGELMREVLGTVETSPEGSTRERTLATLLEGDALHEGEESAIETWLPSVIQDRPQVLAEMAGWLPDEKVSRTTWRSLFDEDTATCRAAARAHIKLHGGADTARAELFAMLQHPVEPRTRAAVLEAFAAEWPQHQGLDRLMIAARRSSDANLRLVAHRWLIDRGEHQHDDLEDLLQLAGRFTDVDYERKPDVFGLIRDGWPGDPEIKKLALNALNQQGSQSLEQDGALWLLLSAYPKDAEVIAYSVREIETAKYPFLTLHFQGWALLAENFRDDPDLVAAIDRWLPDQKFHEPEISYAARVGRTETAKRTLISVLFDSSIPHWPARALLDEWGLEDSEVDDALKEAALGDPRLAGLIAHDISRILTDRKAAVSRLTALLAEPANVRPDLTVMALGELDAMDRDVVDKALVRYEDSGRSEDIWFWLITYAADDARVRKLAAGYLKNNWCTAAVVARAYADDAELRADICRHMTRLPPQLRTRVAERLRDGCGSAQLAANVSTCFLMEDDPLAAATLAQTRVRRALQSDSELLESEVAEGLKARGPRYERTRQAALAAAIELGRIDLFANARNDFGDETQVEIGLTDHLSPNVVLAHSVAEHWAEMRAAVPDPLQRLSKGSSIPANWDVLARVADVSPDLAEEALDALDAGTACSASLLRLYARVRPRDQRMLARCLTILRGELNPSSLAEDVTLAATELIADNYAGDAQALEKVCEAGLFPETLMLVLAEGWPDSLQLKDAIESARRDEMFSRREYVLRVRVAVEKPNAAVKELRHFIAYLASVGRHVDRGVPAIVRRLRRDPAVVEELESAMFSAPSPSETASFARLLVLANPLAATTRERLTEAAEDAFSGVSAIHVAYDIVAGRQRPLAISLLDALGAG